MFAHIRRLHYYLIILIIVGCSNEKTDSVINVNSSGEIIESRIKTPFGFSRIDYEPNTWCTYLRRLSVKPDGAPILDYRGQEIFDQGNHVAVLDLDVGNRDLQQCADAVIRLRAEYLYKEGQYESISFHFTSGDLFGYQEYLNGKRPVVQGNRVDWSYSGETSDSYNNFRNYLNIVFSYAGTISLASYLTPVIDRENLEAGDIIVNPGSPGHAVIIIDKAVNSNGETIFLLAEGYTPAQSIHILDSRENEIAPWFHLDGTGSISTPRYFFISPLIRRF